MFVVLVALFLSGYNKAIKLVPLRSTGPPTAAAYRNVRHYLILVLSGFAKRFKFKWRVLFSYS